MEQISGAELLIKFLEERGVTTVAGVPGGAALPLYDALHGSSIKHILARHEQGAGFIAQGIARATGFPGVTLATSGPGATNLVTAVADAYADSVPLLAITGQVPQHLIGTDAFQEVDACQLFRKITQRSYFVRSADELYAILPEAWSLMTSGRPGPVHIDIPKDVQNQKVDLLPFCCMIPEIKTALPHEIAAAANMIAESARPLLYIGGGIVHAEATAELAEFAREHNIPVVSSLMGLGAFPADHELAIGMLGMHAAPYTSHIMHEADLLIAIGVRFDDRATGKLSEFCPEAKVIHIDIDARELGKLRTPQLAICADAKAALRQLCESLGFSHARDAWHARIAELRASYPLPVTPDAAQSVHFMHELAAELDAADTVTTDVGQHQMWAAQYLPFSEPRRWLTSGGLGTMGFGLPAAIGAALAKESAGRTICITGDGSLLMNIQEFATLAELGLPVKVIILDNGHLGLVRQQQQLFFSGRFSACEFSSAVDFMRIAQAFGLEAVNYDSANPDCLADFLSAGGPGLLHVRIGATEKVLPMVAPGAGNLQMIVEDAETLVST